MPSIKGARTDDKTSVHRASKGSKSVFEKLIRRSSTSLRKRLPNSEEPVHFLYFFNSFWKARCCAPTNRERDCISSPALQAMISRVHLHITLRVQGLLYRSLLQLGKLLQASDGYFAMSGREASNFQLCNLLIQMSCEEAQSATKLGEQSREREREVPSLLFISPALLWTKRSILWCC